MVAISGGGTGGHFFPAYATFKFLKENHLNPIFIGSINSIEAKFEEEKFFLFDIKKNLNFAKRIPHYIKISFKIKKLLKEKKIKLILGFGGYVSFPLYLAAYLSKIPIFIHEQNVLFGKANKIFSKIAKKIFLGFPYFEKKFFKDFDKNRFVWTSNPLRKEVEKFFEEDKIKLKQQLKIPLSKKVLLIFGGSQGALFLNEAFEYIALKYPHLLKNFFIVHITGKNKKFSSLKSLYHQKNIESKVYEFKDNLGPYLKIADLVVCRAGALTVTEICYFRKKTLFVPYPYAYKNHQYENIKPLLEKGLVKCYIQRLKENDKENFCKTFFDFLNWEISLEKLKKLENYILRNSKEIILNEILKEI